MSVNPQTAQMKRPARKADGPASSFTEATTSVLSVTRQLSSRYFSIFRGANGDWLAAVQVRRDRVAGVEYSKPRQTRLTLDASFVQFH